MPRLNKLTDEEKEDTLIINSMIKRGLQSGADLAKRFRLDRLAIDIVKKFGPLFKKLLEDKIINKDVFLQFMDIVEGDNPSMEKVEELYNKYSKEEPEVKKVKKSELKKIIKKAFEDDVITKKKYDTLMEQYSEKEYEKIIKYINNNNEILDNI